MAKMLTLGNFEEKYLSEALLHLGMKHSKDPLVSQLQRAAKKMVTELHTKSVARGAVEGVNLATRYREDDALAAECIRTFPTIPLKNHHDHFNT